MRYLHRATTRQGFIDLHNHTNFSYGHEMGKMNLHPLQLLEEMREYTEKFNKPVTFSLTDHNNINGNRQIIKAMQENPDKYKLVTFIPGCEYTCACDSIGHIYDEKGKEQPIVNDNRLHMLAYGMDLENSTVKYLNTLMSTAKRFVREYVTEFKPIKSGNIVFTTRAWLKKKGIELELSEFENDCPIGSFDETMQVVENFLIKRFKFNSRTMESWRKFVTKTDNLITYTKADVQEVMSIVEKAGGYTVLAHPFYDGPSEALQNLYLKDERNTAYKNISFDDVNYKRMPEEEKERNLRKMENYYDFLYRKLSIKAKNPITGKKLQGIVGHELMHSANQKNKYKLNVIMNTGDKYGLYCTGGSDSHGDYNYYVIPSRVVGAQVQNYDTMYKSSTAAYCLYKCDFVQDFIKAKENGEKLTREVGRVARNQITILKTSETGEKFYDMNDFLEVVFKSYERKKKDEQKATSKSKLTDEQEVDDTFIMAD